MNESLRVINAFLLSDRPFLISQGNKNILKI